MMTESQVTELPVCLETQAGDASPAITAEPVDIQSPVPPEGVPGQPDTIVCKVPARVKRKIDTSIRPAVRVEIVRLTRVFNGWAPPDTKLSDRNKIDMNDTQLQAILYAREQHVTPVQIADVLGVSVYRVHHIIQHAKTVRKRQKDAARKQSSLNNYGSTADGSPAPLSKSTEEPLVSHIQKKLVIDDTSPRI